jgi:hypothetical protein
MYTADAFLRVASASISANAEVGVSDWSKDQGDTQRIAVTADELHNVSVSESLESLEFLFEILHVLSLLEVLVSS